jgi:hypothetical protein
MVQTLRSAYAPGLPCRICEIDAIAAQRAVDDEIALLEAAARRH